MKINILVGNPGGYLDGYLNLDCFASTGDKTLLCSPLALGEYIEDGEAEVIRACNILSFFRAQDVMTMLEHWVSKLAYDGELIISDVDMVQTINAFSRSELNFIELNAIIYGPQSKNWDGRKCALCLSELAAALTDLNLEIFEKRFDGVIFTIRAKRICQKQ